MRKGGRHISAAQSGKRGGRCMAEAAAATEEKHGFQAEVSRLLDIVAHSLYSEKDVFLRELVSNASDACDRLRYLSLTQPELTAEDASFRVTLSIDRQRRRLTIADNGIGMN